MIEYNVSEFLKFIYDKNFKLFFIMRKICMYILNLYAVIYYNLLNKLKKQKLKRNDRKPEIIVSLTSYGQRINKVWLPIEMMFNQTVRPNRIILWLDRNEFSDNFAYSEKIKRLIKRGLEIKYCDNIMGHKKYYYSMKENTEDILIMIDDDIIYHNKIIEELLFVDRDIKNYNNLSDDSKLKSQLKDIIDSKLTDYARQLTIRLGTFEISFLPKDKEPVYVSEGV